MWQYKQQTTADLGKIGPVHFSHGAVRLQIAGITYVSLAGSQVLVLSADTRGRLVSCQTNLRVLAALVSRAKDDTALVLRVKGAGVREPLQLRSKGQWARKSELSTARRSARICQCWSL